MKPGTRIVVFVIGALAVVAYVAYYIYRAT